MDCPHVLQFTHRSHRQLPVIDTANCIHFKTGKCGICSKVCAAGAVNYDQKDEVITREYGAIVVATGFDTINLDKFDEYYYNQSKDVITSLEMERLMNAAGPTGCGASRRKA